MKIYVNKMPIKPEDCLFARRFLANVAIDPDTGDKKYIVEHECCVNMKRCYINRGGKCNKLRTLPDE